ncbi:efflux RND transporter periplasmic adaptor subunit [Lebetimonas sp. JS032]|uniref:efflux RND transporter periplasmic adaptor subunit n=1 Tax=Lebetimonas sp. JS032 TaxID=990070 RepID=UPI000466413C|nr:efflux RND transporter periplasmic adaptor subunit [Lebetimonas sp. JS032]
MIKKIALISAFSLSLFAYEFATVKKGVIQIKKDYVADIYAKRQVMLAPRVMGYIKEIKAEEGEKVKKGELLFVVDPTDVYSMLNQARGALLQAQSGVLMAEMTYADAKRDYERFKNLYKAGAVSKRDFEKMTLNMNIRKKQVDMAKGMLKRAKAALVMARNQIKYAKVKSPINAVVTRKMKNVGEMALPGYPVLILSDLSSLKAKSFVKEGDIDKFKLGMKVEIFVPAINKKYKAKVENIIPSADPATHSYIVKFKFNKYDDKLLPGMYAKAKIILGKKEAVLVPFAALTSREGIMGVFVNRDGIAKFIAVKQIAQEGDYIALKGLNAGEKVILYPPANMIDGQKL